MKPCPNPECKKSRPLLHGTEKLNDCYIYCRSCQTSGPIGDTPKEAERLWDLLPRQAEVIVARFPCPNPDCLNDKITLVNIEGSYQVSCYVCGLSGPVEQDAVSAWKSWNNLPRHEEIEFTKIEFMQVRESLPPEIESMILRLSPSHVVIGHRVGHHYFLDYTGTEILDRVIGWKPLNDII